MNTPINTETLEHVTDIFKALSETNRIRIMHLLSQNSSSVGHIAHTLNMGQSNV